MKRHYRLFIEDIFDCIQKVDKFVGEMTFEEFAKDAKLQAPS